MEELALFMSMLTGTAVLFLAIGLCGVAVVAWLRFQALEHRVLSVARAVRKLRDEAQTEAKELDQAAAPERIAAKGAQAPPTEASTALHGPEEVDSDQPTEVVEPPTIPGDPVRSAATSSGRSVDPPSAERVVVSPPFGGRITLDRILMWVAGAMGGLFVIVGLLLTLKIVWDSGWVTASVRVAGGLCFGTAAWVAGAIVRRRLRVVGSALEGVAIGTLLGSLYAAHALFALLGSGSTFGLMVAVTAVATLRAGAENDRFMAYLGMFGGFMTPIMVSTGENSPVAFFGYLFLLVAGVMIAAHKRRWFDVAIVAAMGFTLLYLGWTVSWYAPDQVVHAVVAIFAVSLPFAVVGGQKRDLTSIASGAVAMLVPLLALPWLVPVGGQFVDPVSGLVVYRPAGASVWWATSAVALLGLPGWISARGRSDPWTAGVGVFVVGTLAMTFGFGWAFVADDGPARLLSVGLIAPMAVGTLVFFGRPRVGTGLAALPLFLGLPLLALMAEHEGAMAPVHATAALGVIALLAAYRSTTPWVLVSTLLAVTLGSGVAGLIAVNEGVLHAAGPLLVLYTALAVPTMIVKWGPDARPLHRAGAWWAAVLAGPLLFPGLYVIFKDLTGGQAVGLVPLFFGGVALLGAVALLRRHNVTRADLSFAGFILVALMGVTAALPLELEERWLTVGLGLEVLALAAVSRRVTHPLIRYSAVFMALVVAVRLVVNPAALAYADTSGLPILNWTLYTWGLPFVCLLGAAAALDFDTPSQGKSWNPFVKHLPAVVVLSGLFVGFALVNVQVSHAFQDAGPVELGGAGLFQGMVRSLGWAVYGVVVLGVGLGTGRKMVRLVGFGFLMLTAVKVFLWDLWALAGFVRVGSVFGLGITLLLAALMFELLVLREYGNEKDDSEAA